MSREIHQALRHQTLKKELTKRKMEKAPWQKKKHQTANMKKKLRGQVYKGQEISNKKQQ